MILFAKGKFKTSSFKSEEEAALFDPLGLMIVTRPNTGTNFSTDMKTSDLKTKYRLALSCDQLRELLEKEDDSSISAADDNAENMEETEEVAEEMESDNSNGAEKMEVSEEIEELAETSNEISKHPKIIQEVIRNQNKFV